MSDREYGAPVNTINIKDTPIAMTLRVFMAALLSSTPIVFLTLASDTMQRRCHRENSASVPLTPAFLLLIPTGITSRTGSFLSSTHQPPPRYRLYRNRDFVYRNG